MSENKKTRRTVLPGPWGDVVQNHIVSLIDAGLTADEAVQSARDMEDRLMRLQSQQSEDTVKRRLMPWHRYDPPPQPAPPETLEDRVRRERLHLPPRKRRGR